MSVNVEFVEFGWDLCPDPAVPLERRNATNQNAEQRNKQQCWYTIMNQNARGK